MSNITLLYYDTDDAFKISQNGTTTQVTLDSAGRRLLQTVTNTGSASVAGDGVVARTLARHYTDDSDNTAWAVEKTASETVEPRYASLIGGDLALAIVTDNNGTKGQLSLAGLGGDIATTVTITDAMADSAAGSAATGIDRWATCAEYGTPKQAASQNLGGVTGIGYGWIGTKERAATETGLALMGARLYNHITGLFTSLDPKYQGGDTWYGYPSDPVNGNDIGGTD